MDSIFVSFDDGVCNLQCYCLLVWFLVPTLCLIRESGTTIFSCWNRLEQVFLEMPSSLWCKFGLLLLTLLHIYSISYAKSMTALNPSGQKFKGSLSNLRWTWTDVAPRESVSERVSPEFWILVEQFVEIWSDVVTDLATWSADGAPSGLCYWHMTTLEVITVGVGLEAETSVEVSAEVSNEIAA